MSWNWRAYWEIKLALIWGIATVVSIGGLQLIEANPAIPEWSLIPTTIIMWAGLVVIGLCLYFLPTLVARSRQHRNVPPIFVLNLVFGWTLIGWVGCMAWALLAQEAPAD